MPELIVISGPPGAGKSTIALEVAKRRHRCAVLERDSFYGFLAVGFIPPWSPEAAPQNDASLRACARAVPAYLDYCDVVVTGVFDPPSLQVLVAELEPAAAPIHFIRLVVAREVAIARAMSRSRNLRLGIPAERYGVMFDQFAAYGEFAGVELDCTALTPECTASKIESLLRTRAAVLRRIQSCAV